MCGGEGVGLSWKVFQLDINDTKPDMYVFIYI